MRNYCLISEKEWHLPLYERLQKRDGENWTLINSRAAFSADKIAKLNVRKVFIPHWSYLIPDDVFNHNECIVFHMTDLPFGRGGSPMQNLISRGFSTTKISAIRVEAGLDTGAVYLKKDLDLSGTAEDIFFRTVPIIGDMIEMIIDKDIEPVPQEGPTTVFKRRTPAQSDILGLTTLPQLYDQIRMLDGFDYPKAFLESGNFRIEFSKAQLSANEITAYVRIIEK